GFDQLVRSGSRTDWKYRVPQKENQTVPLRKSLRLKGNLCRFANAFAESLGLDWEVEPNSDVYGGRVVVLQGRYGENPELHEHIYEKHAKQGNKPIDMLLCVPPRLAQINDVDGHSVVARKLKDWGWQVWDGVVEDRGKEPETVEQFRVVQYDSCRGLEGWSVVNLGFDNFYDWKFNASLKSFEGSNLLVSPEQAAHQHAARWLMIPLTRAIDTLVLQISSSDHVITEALRDAKNKCKDVVEWREWNGATGVFEPLLGERTTTGP
nr:RNA helicase [Actinomycetota bacterium]